ncbi:hypothetical protein CNMCM8980_008695 [Aspergillus fumigatiaffinis]|jgi:hypothetical protein|uniref:Uncharacterized protein n=1 Tax=Aspergillus fumigatiaffinis TaxID=340414 RepID=A0A8H4LZQ8_9EURO|nr:hypothetical protein CNMCM5878_005306 [Aspergillus fumigatiaffinis]KAF4223168.1 hypothetical protein CNMCM6457_000657 [Aspergillus fumigatiaffinis]KAF4229159.1 hypothetical protein CNMCM6805_001611 [Aspergillus fumigatiaffinis]KAF4246387.1 hypothetical protein CNMCM8980_008695 [Aspergillus fumigatiaffinis]
MELSLMLFNTTAELLISVAQSSPPPTPHLTSGTSGASARHRLRPNRRASNRGPSGIDVSLTDDHFNVGQKRLLFLARAKVRAGSILILAKVTTSVDWETNQLVQKISRERVARARSSQFISGLYNASNLYMAAI